VGLAAGHWTLEIHWTDAQGASLDFTGSVVVDGRADVTVDVATK
jgi:hypothetical protein